MNFSNWIQIFFCCFIYSISQAEPTVPVNRSYNCYMMDDYWTSGNWGGTVRVNRCGEKVESIKLKLKKLDELPKNYASLTGRNLLYDPTRKTVGISIENNDIRMNCYLIVDMNLELADVVSKKGEFDALIPRVTWRSFKQSNSGLDEFGKYSWGYEARMKATFEYPVGSKYSGNQWNYLEVRCSRPSHLSTDFIALDEVTERLGRWIEEIR